MNYLLVDAQVDFAFVVRLYLEIEGHQVVTVTPEEAARIIEEFEFDGYLIGSGAIGPDISALLQEKKKGLRGRKPVTIFWSEQLLSAWQLGTHCDHFFVKPFSLEVLADLLRESS